MRHSSAGTNQGVATMPVILIADASKPSLVMSSEIFKDKVPGALILVATTGKQCLELLLQKPDMCVVDFDLPDTDGVTLITAMRKSYKGPVLLTAYPDRIVQEAVASDLFAFNDAGAWVPKPVKFDVLSEKIDLFLLDKHRLGRRFDVSLETLIIGKGAGRGKRAPKVTGRITNISLGGACVELNEPMKMKDGEEMTVSLALPGELAVARTSQAKKAELKSVKAKLTLGSKPAKSAAESKLKCTVAWIDKKHTRAGIMFSRLTDVQKRGLESLLRNCLFE